MPFSGYDDLNAGFGPLLQAFIQASGGRISVTSGFRSVERQEQLWQQALAKYGDPEIADNWVARPGKSNHNHGIAADLGFADAAARQWAHANAARFGLHFPMSWEPWHIEPLGAHAHSDPGAYTTPPTGYENPANAVEDPHDPITQFGRLMGAMVAPQQVISAPDTGVLAAPEAPDAGTEIEQQMTQVVEGGTDGGQL